MKEIFLAQTLNKHYKNGFCTKIEVYAIPQKRPHIYQLLSLESVCQVDIVTNINNVG